METSKRKCTCCGQNKPVGDFYQRKSFDPPRYQQPCKVCRLAGIKRPIEARGCGYCGLDFIPARRRDARFCSDRCSRTASARARGVVSRNAVVDGRKRCNTCHEWKPVDQFTPRKQRGGAPISDCRPCVAATGREWNQTDAGRDSRYRRVYGVTVEWYDAQYDIQEGKCAICPKTAERGKLVVDHNHRTGAVRGLLCRQCNVAIGLLQEDPVRLAAAIAYLQRE